MIAVLQDPSQDVVRQLGLLIYQKAAYIKNNIDLNKLDISVERREKLEKAMNIVLKAQGDTTTRPLQ